MPKFIVICSNVASLKVLYCHEPSSPKDCHSLQIFTYAMDVADSKHRATENTYSSSPMIFSRSKLPVLDCGSEPATTSFCRLYVPTTKNSGERGTNSIQLGGRSNVVEQSGFINLLNLGWSIADLQLVVLHGIAQSSKPSRIGVTSDYLRRGIFRSAPDCSSVLYEAHS